MSFKLIISILLFSGILFQGYATTRPYGGDYQDKLNWKDDQGRKQGHWIVLGSDRPTEGYPPEGKVEEGDYKDNRKDGVWIKYHNDGKTPRLKGEYDFGRPKGAFTKYAENGQVIEDGTFEQGKYTGDLKRFYEDGTPKYVANYNESGQETGKVVYYHPNGKVEFEYTAVDGVPTGSATRYWPNGDVKEQIVFDDAGTVKTSVEKEMVSTPVKVETETTDAKAAPASTGGTVKSGTFNKNGYNKVFNKNDELWMDGDFQNGKLYDGKVYIYDKDGILEKIEVYKKGRYHSDGQL